MNKMLSARDSLADVPITVVFRFDDYAQTSSTETEFSLFDAFSEFNIPCLVGVIPFAGDQRVPLGGQKARVLRDAVTAGTLQVALHGCHHEKVCTRPVSSEFLGLEFAVQEAKLAKGKGFLEDILGEEVASFIPPWNSFDSNTLLALDQLGFRLISANTRKPHAAGRPPIPTNLDFLPATCEPYCLREAVQVARATHDVDPIIVVVIHAFDFREQNKAIGKLTIRQFRDLLEWIKLQKDVHIASFEKVCKGDKDLSFRRLNANLHRYPPRYPPRFLPEYLAPERLWFVYLSSRSARYRKAKLWFRVFGVPRWALRKWLAVSCP